MRTRKTGRKVTKPITLDQLVCGALHGTDALARATKERISRRRKVTTGLIAYGGPKEELHFFPTNLYRSNGTWLISDQTGLDGLMNDTFLLTQRANQEVQS